MEEEYKYQYHPNQCHLFFHHSSTIFPTLTHKTCFINKSKKKMQTSVLPSHHLAYTYYMCVFTVHYFIIIIFYSLIVMQNIGKNG